MYNPIPYTPEERDIAVEFAYRREPSSAETYSKDGQTNSHTRRLQIMCGAILEQSVHKWLNLFFGLSIPPPDFTLHEAKEKRFGFDLRSTLGIHVKSYHLEMSHYGPSWIVQASPERKDPVRKGKDGAIMIFGEVSSTAKTSTIRAVIETKILKEHNLYAEPGKKGLSGKKKAIYLRDILKLPVELRWALHTLKKETQNDISISGGQI